jgi:hypothetical protein
MRYPENKGLKSRNKAILYALLIICALLYLSTFVRFHFGI